MQAEQECVPGLFVAAMYVSMCGCVCEKWREREKEREIIAAISLWRLLLSRCINSSTLAIKSSNVF